MKKLLFTTLCLSLLSTHVLAQTIRYVSPTGNGDGSSWTNASGNIQAVLNISSSGDQVWIAGGTYILPATLEVYEGVNVYGGFAGNESNVNQRPQSDMDNNGTIEAWEFTNTTILDGQESIQVLYVHNSTIDGVTVSNGLNMRQGGGIQMNRGLLINSIVKDNKSYLTYDYSRGGGIYGDSITVSNCLVNNNNSVGHGGGIYILKGKVIDCTISENIARSFGGAIYGDSITVSGCVVENNTGGDASNYAYGNGGIRITAGQITDCIVRGNKSKSNYGSAIYIPYDSSSTDVLVTVSGCIVENNDATLFYLGTCGGISGSALVSNSLVCGNTGYFGGGAAGGTYINCTFIDNSASSGGGIYSGTAINCIFLGNTAPYAGAQVYQSEVSYSAVQGGYEGTGNMDITPDNENGGAWFVNPEAGDYRLQACSPCVNIGNNDALSVNDMVDLAGNPRIYNNTVDMGAYEFQGGICQSGCTDRYAENYDPNAVKDDSSCIYRKIEEPIAGCTDITSVNYNPVATINDNSCISEAGGQPVYGCTDCRALNYNPQATDYEVGSCVYSNVENTYFIPKEEIIGIPVDTIATDPVEKCDLISGLGITSAYISGITPKNGNNIIVHWVIVQNENPVYYDVECSATHEGSTMFYLSIICKQDGLLRSSADVTGYTVSAIANVDLSGSGIYQIDGKTSTVEVYPNPTNGMLYIKTASGHTPVLKLYNLQGIQLFESKSKEINLSGLDKSIYLLQVDDTLVKIMKK